MPTGSKAKPTVLPKYRLTEYLNKASNFQRLNISCSNELSMYLTCWSQFQKEGPDAFRNGCKVRPRPAAPRPPGLVILSHLLLTFLAQL